MYKEDKVKQAFEMIEQGVKDVYTSDKFTEYLQMLSKFHHYSMNNIILILNQYPSASLVAGYNSWRDNFKRHVNKGEKAIRILAPYEVLVKQEQEKEDHTKEVKEVKIRKFRMVNVFDVSQTSGEPLPELIDNLKGNNNKTKALIASIYEISKTPIELHSTKDEPEFIAGAKGYYDRKEDKIVVCSDMEEMQICKTMVHEYAHSILHKENNGSKEQKEIEAESIAFVVCNHFGIDTSDYSFAYIASFAMNNEDLLKSTLANIQIKAREIIDEIQPVFEKYQELNRDVSIQKDYRLLTPVGLEEISKPLINDLYTMINGTDAYDILSSPVGTTDIGLDVLQETVGEGMKKLRNQYPELFELYSSDPYCKTGLETAVLFCCNEDMIDQNTFHPFIDSSIERQLYDQFEGFANPILNNTAEYIAMDSLYYDDIFIERLDENHIAISRHYELNGDLMASPDVEMVVDNENRLLYPQSYQNDEEGTFRTVQEEPGFKNELNRFMTKWFDRIPGSHYKINRIMGEGFDLTDQSNRKEIYEFCKKSNIEKMAKKVTEKKNHEL